MVSEPVTGAEQLQSVGCPKCGTILNAKAAGCTDPWHADNRPAQVSEPVPAEIYNTDAYFDAYRELRAEAAARLTAAVEDAYRAGVAAGRTQAAADIRKTLDVWSQLGKLPQSYLDGVADAAHLVEGTDHDT